PFAGVATTAVACKETGRQFLGYEINPEWHTVGLRRVEAAREQLALAGFGLEQVPAQDALSARVPERDSDATRKALTGSQKALTPSPSASPRTCSHCGHPIPRDRRRHARYCGPNCRVMACRDRRPAP